MSFSQPHDIEIEINSHCNLSCSYCPNSVAERIEKGTMEKELFLKIMSQLKTANYKGRIAFDFYNEPMLAKDFLFFVKETRKHLPDSLIELYTNGMFIKDKAHAEALIGAGLTKIVITKHEEVESLPIESFYENLNQKTKEHYILKDHTDLTMTNRGGLLTGLGADIPTGLPCLLPSLMMTVTVKGNVLPCFEDFNQTEVMGNINESNILEIWNNEKFVKFREDLLKGKRDNYEICKNCNRISESLRPENNKHFFGDEEIDAIKRVIESKNFFRYQPGKSECLLFEEEFSQKLKVPYSLTVTSGTNALILALAAEDIGPGDEVIIPSYTFVATASAVLNRGAIPVLANIDGQLGLCPADVESKITKKTKAIIPVHMDGLICNMKEILNLAKKHKLIVIEDSAQCLGGKYKDSYVGSLADYGCFSLNMDKVLTAGEGGIVTTNSRQRYEKLCSLSDGAFSFSPHHKDFFKQAAPGLGYSMRVSEITGAIMREQIKKLPQILSEYKTRKKILVSELKDNPLIEVIEGHDKEGDICISLHLKFQDPEKAIVYGKVLREKRIAAIPITLRPAHVSWKWNDYLENKTGLKYPKSEVLQTFDIIMSVLRIQIDLSWSIEKTQEIAVTMNKCLQGK